MIKVAVVLSVSKQTPVSLVGLGSSQAGREGGRERITVKIECLELSLTEYLLSA